MKWFKDEELPEEIRGKSPAEIKAFLAQQQKDADDAKAALAVANAAAETQKTEFEGVKARLASIEANRTTQQQTAPKTEPTEKTSFLVDEDAAFNERVAPVVGLALHSAAMTARMMALQSIPAKEQRLFNKYASEVEAIMAKESPERKIHSQTWLNAWTYVKGMHTQELVDAASKGDNAFFIEGAGNSPGNTGGGGEDKKEELTPQELDIAKKMKISPEAYLKNKKGITQYVG